MKHNSIRQMWQALRVFMLLFACCVSSIAWGQGTNSVKRSHYRRKRRTLDWGKYSGKAYKQWNCK